MDVTLIARDAQSAGGPDPRVFDSEQMPAAVGALADLRVTVGGADLAAPPVVLPDFHHKSNMELPSSVAVATRTSVRPTLTSASVNCGMALIALNSPRAGPDGNRRVLPPRPRALPLSAGDEYGAVGPGCAGLCPRRRGVRGRTVWHRYVDSRARRRAGRLDLDRYDGADRLQRELPGLVLQLARLRFGMVGPTNHFIELQEVEEVFDPDTAAGLGVAPGQMTLQYHAGGGRLRAVGAMFGRRKHYPKQIRAAMSVVKPLYHGMSARSLSQLKQRYRLYFAGGCPPVPLDSDEGRRLMLANAAAMNYGFAFRIAIYAGLRQIATDVFGGPPGQLVVDSPHNSIYEETVGGEPAVVHRPTRAALTRRSSCRGRRPSPRPARRCWFRAPTGRRLPVCCGRIGRRTVFRLPWRRHRGH